MQRPLEVVLTGGVTAKTEKLIAMWTSLAHFPFGRTLAAFHFSSQSSLEKQQIQALTACRFVETGENVLLLGPPGVGKIHLPLGLGLTASQQGYRVLFATVTVMISPLTKAMSKGGLERKCTLYTTPRLLILNKIRDLPVDRLGANRLCPIISPRFERGPVILTSNQSFADHLRQDSFGVGLHRHPPEMVSVGSAVAALSLQIRAHDFRACSQEPPLRHHQDLDLLEAGQAFREADLGATHAQVVDFPGDRFAGPEARGIYHAAFDSEVQGQARMPAGGRLVRKGTLAYGDRLTPLHGRDVSERGDIDRPPLEEEVLGLPHHPEKGREQGGGQGNGLPPWEAIPIAGSRTRKHLEFHVRFPADLPKGDPNLPKLIADKLAEFLHHGLRVRASRSPAAPETSRVVGNATGHETIIM